ELLADERKKRLLVQLDVLVDGKFVNELKDYRLVFKGSRNQRIIDVQKSLQSGSVILSEKDEQNQKLKEEDMINA
ncbi:radical SAM protein, partial [[Clostridium] scindens]